MEPRGATSTVTRTTVSQSRLVLPGAGRDGGQPAHEDNLPSYHREIAEMFGRDGAWGTWVHRWTAEEGRHAYVMRDYLLVTRGVDPELVASDRTRPIVQCLPADQLPRPCLDY